MEGGAVAYCNGSTAMNVPSCECKHSIDLSEIINHLDNFSQSFLISHN